MNIEQTEGGLQEALDKERAERARLQEEHTKLQLYFSEMEATNNHLVSATWRERDMKKKLADTIEELNQTRMIVETQNRRITESINYARKIQLAINPTDNDLANHFAESFILYQPKDVISGDFPWIYQYKDYLYVASVDCTGHGVPGAMMSMIGNLLLNDIVNKGDALPPSEILKKLHESVVSTLKQNSSANNSNDGMDMALCRIRKSEKQIVFSGAHRPLFHLRDGVVESIPGNKFPIGGLQYKGLNNYPDTIIDYREGDVVFLFSDGYPDQIGGPDNRKFMVRQLRELIEANAAQPMAKIREVLHEAYLAWKGTNKQIDDILIVGIKL